jgi:hypothetical protein
MAPILRVPRVGSGHGRVRHGSRAAAGLGSDNDFAGNVGLRGIRKWADAVAEVARR